MPHPSKRKGNRFERELVAQAQAAGIEAERAWGSDGRNLGMAPDVDLLVGGLRVQAKRRAKIADYMTPPASCDLAVIRQDRGEALAVLRFETLLDLLNNR